MVTGELKRRVDALWTEFWQGGITNPLTVIEQITFLMYARLLDINESRDENRFKRSGKRENPPRFKEDEQHLRWSQFRHLGSDQMLPLVRDKVFPHFIAHQLPVGISGLILAALAAAIMSSIDSGIHSISTVCTVDFYQRFSAIPPSDTQKLRFARTLMPFLGLTVCLLAAFAIGSSGESIVERAQRPIGFLVGPILGVFVLAIFVPRAGTRAVWAGVVGGLTLGLLVAFGHELPGLSMPELSFSLSLPCSAAATILCGAGISLLRIGNDSNKLP